MIEQDLVWNSYHLDNLSKTCFWGQQIGASDIEFGNGEFLAGGTNIVIKSNDGINWTQILSKTVQGISYLQYDVKNYKYSHQVY